jgi:hypothetical protein
MRRGLLRLTVAVVVLLTVLAMATPAFAAGWNSAGCRGNDLLFRVAQLGLRIDHNDDGYICPHVGPGPSGYDNRFPIVE